MKRIQSRKDGIAKRILIRAFIQPSKNPEFFDIFALSIEMALFTLFISSWLPIQPSSIGFKSKVLPDISNQSERWIGYFIIGIYCAFIAIRVIFLKNLWKPIYILAIIAVEQGEFAELVWVKTIIWFLVVISIAIDILSNYELLFTSQNFHSEYCNSHKILHYAIMVVAIFLRLYQKKIQHGQIIGPTISFLLFSVLFVTKLSSITRNKNNQQMYLRFYLFTILLEVINLISNWIPSLEQLYIQTIVIVISQLIYTFVRKKNSKLKSSDFISQGNKVKSYFNILCYCFGNEYDKDYEQILNEFSEDEKKSQEGKRKSKIGPKIYELLQETSSFKSLLLRAQVRFYLLDQIILAKQDLMEAKSIQQNSSCLSIIPSLFRRLLTFKFERYIQGEIEKKYKINQISAFKDFLKNEQIRTLMIKCTLDTLTMWEAVVSYRNKNQIIYKQFIGLVYKVLSKRKKFKHLFFETEVICSQVMRNCLEYIYYVQQDIQQANQLANKFESFPESHIFLQSDEKIYISLEMETDNFMEISCVSYNIKKLLGYNKHSVKGQNVSIFVPNFFADFHQTAIQDKIAHHNSNQLYSFYKQTIIRHEEQYYLPMKAHLKIVYDQIDGKIFLQGYLKVKKQRYYDWTNYFFMSSATNQILELGKPLSSEIIVEKDSILRTPEIFTAQSNIKNHHQDDLERPRLFLVRGELSQAEEYRKRFNDKLFYPIEDDSVEYHLIQQIMKGNLKIKYYVAKQSECPKDESAIDEGNKKEEEMELFNESDKLIPNYKKFPQFSLKFGGICPNLELYFSSSQATLSDMKSKSFIVWLVIIILLTVTAFGFQTYLTINLARRPEKNKEYLKDFESIKVHTNDINQMCFQADLLQLLVKYNYAVYSSQYQYHQSAFSLQTTTQILSKYNKKLYQSHQEQSELFGIQHQPKYAQSIIDELTTAATMLDYLGNYNILSISLDNFQKRIEIIYSSVLQDYVEGYVSAIKNSSENDQILRIIFTSVIALLLTVSTIIIYVKMKKLKQLEFNSVSALLKINVAHIFINYSNQFLRKCIGEASGLRNDLKYFNNVSLIKTVHPCQTRHKNMSSGSVSSRQNSVRDLINSFSRQEIEDVQQEDTKELNNQELKPPNNLLSKKYTFPMFLTCGLFVLYVIGLNIYIQENHEGNLVQLLRKLSGILERQIYFSSTTITFLNGLATGNFQLFEKNLNKYKEIQGNADTDFVQSNQRFPKFNQKLNQMKYQYLCSFMECPEKYQSDFNIVYETAIHKMNTYMSNNMNVQEVTQNNHQLEIAIYCNVLTTTVTNGILDAFLSDFQKKSSSFDQVLVSLEQIQEASIIINYLMLAIYSIITVGFAIWVRNEKERINEIINFVINGNLKFEENDLDQKKNAKASMLHKLH